LFLESNSSLALLYLIATIVAGYLSQTQSSLEDVAIKYYASILKVLHNLLSDPVTVYLDSTLIVYLLLCVYKVSISEIS